LKTPALRIRILLEGGVLLDSPRYRGLNAGL
jgi:hypothetical protein